MPATINEHTQFLDSGGAPLVFGKVYIGTQNADPVLNPILIFSDRALTVTITNPQALDANGRTTNKIWVTGRYSMRVDNLNDVQQYQELDNGEESASGITSLTNVSGSNTITATAVTTITFYVDRELYIFRTAGANTGAITLNIDGVGATSVVKNHDKPIDAGNFELNQNIIVSYNLTDDVFEWVNQNTIFSTNFTSAEQTITAGGLLTLAHGLPAFPKFVQLWAICKTAEFNYSIGDEILLAPATMGGAGITDRGYGLRADATNILIRTNSTTGINYMDANAGTYVLLTLPNWKYIARAAA